MFFFFSHPQKLAGATLLVFSNKQDVEGCLQADQISQILNLQGTVGVHRHWHIQACSAVTGEGLLQGIDWLVTDISSRIFMAE
jgi:ADP-ribosylation factor-like protein 2